jgi:hypothetical protein
MFGICAAACNDRFHAVENGEVLMPQKALLLLALRNQDWQSPSRQPANNGANDKVGVDDARCQISANLAQR